VALYSHGHFTGLFIAGNNGKGMRQRIVFFKILGEGMKSD
jgi:hypothetical protein